MFTPKHNVSVGRYNALDSSVTNNTSFNRTPGRANVSQFHRKPATPSFGRNIEFTRASDKDDAPLHEIEEFGGGLPIALRETLALRKASTQSSVKCGSSGNAWLVSDQQLLIWDFSTAAQRKVSQQCHELSLPFTSSVITANHVAVFTSPQSNSYLACIVASPEGHLRYWPDVAQPGLYGDVTMDPKDDECAALVAMKDGTCILSTSNSALHLVSPIYAQRSVRCHELKGGAGMLSGLGRRVSSLFWGAHPTPQHSMPLHQLLAGEGMGEGRQAFYVLCGTYFQKWILHQEQEKLLYQCDIGGLFRDYIAQEIWGENESRLSQLKTWLLDIQLNSDGILLLGAALNSDVSSAVHYALGTLHTDGDGPPQSFLSFCVPGFTMPYQSEQEADLLAYSLLKADSRSDSAYIYDKFNIICASVSKSGETVDKLQFSSTGDKLLGAGLYKRQNLFFSTQHGLLVVREKSQRMDASLSESFLDTSARIETCMVNNRGGDNLAEMSVSEDRVARLKAAFFNHCRGNKDEAERIVEELFPSGVPDEAASLLDTLVVQLSQDMIDDYPASDPRWAESQPSDGGSSSSSLLLLHQLEDKLKAHDILVKFLQNMQLWTRMSCVEMRGSSMNTRLVLCEHAEKVSAATALRQQHSKFPGLIDASIRRVIKSRGNINPSDRLTPQDHFYREVSRVDDIITALVEYEDEQQDIGPKDLVSLVITVNTIIHSMVQAASDYRQVNGQTFKEPPSVSPAAETEYQPWTAASGPKCVRGLITKQHSITWEKALGTEGDTGERDQLFQQLLQLSDMLLEGYRAQLDSIKVSLGGESLRYMEILHQYESIRQKLISPFVANHQFDRAACLAEKYCDFRTLVELCESTKNQERLQRYIQQYAGQGFSDFLFKWYVEQGKRGELLSMDQLAKHPQLSHFLQSDENQFMSWLHDIAASDFLKAHSTLFDLAKAETDNFCKKKTLMSLSKLSAWATKDPPDLIHNNWEAIGQEQLLMLHQEQLPQPILQSMGVDPDKMGVFSPSDLIQLYIGDLNSEANEFDFKKALDLLSFTEKEKPASERESLLLDIWSNSIVRDRWDELDTNNPDESGKDTVFFRTVELAFHDGLDLGSYLPSREKLTASPILLPLRANPKFDYLLGAVYEHILRVMVAQ